MRFLLAFLFLLCSCGGGGSRGVLRVGVDPYWYPIDFGTQTSYVNGFAEDLLLELARYTGIEIERIPASWDNLTDGLKEKKYDAILTSMEPYEFNAAKYDFSSNFLDLGPVAVFPAVAKETDLSKMDMNLVGIIFNDPAILILEKHPKIVIRNYSTIPDMLTAVVNGEIQAALLGQIPAVNYVADLYAGKLKIVGGPMTAAGLHLVSPKGKNHLVAAFNHGLEAFKKKKILDSLHKKWQLAI